jgi:DNA-binding MarR family transcriptional regulator
MHATGQAKEPSFEPDSLVDAVLRASRVLVAIAARSLADAGEDVTLTQYRSLVVLASRGPQTVAELADLLAVTPPTASRLCERLVRKGLIRRRAGRHDRRQVHIALTETGRELIDAVTVRRRGEIADLFAAIPLETQRSLVEALIHLADVAGETPEQEWSAGWDL